MTFYRVGTMTLFSVCIIITAKSLSKEDAFAFKERNVVPFPMRHEFTTNSSVLLIGHQFTGLEFLGELLSTTSDGAVFYIGEPLMYVDHQTWTHYEVVYYLHQLFSCEFTNINHKLEMVQCKSNNVQMCNEETLKSECKERQVRMIKQPIMGLPHLKHITVVGIQVVYVTRDPRAMHVDPYLRHRPEENTHRPDKPSHSLSYDIISTYCASAVDDLYYMVNDGSYINMHLLRYEDLAANLLSYGRTLCEQLDISCALYTFNFTQFNQAYNTKLSRDTITSTTETWLSKIDDNELILETICARMMSMLGYMPLKDIVNEDRYLFRHYKLYREESAAFYDVVVSPVHSRY